MIRVGQGFDVHALVSGRALVLGGVHIPHPKGLQGHSDADVLLHAICDACLGAAGLGDIGHHFPPSDPQYKNIDSRVLLQRVRAALVGRRWQVVNVDATVIAEVPRVAPHVSAMKANIAADLGMSPEQVNIKATTTEQLGFAGRQEGIAAQAVVLIETI
jgi:2-C-methyl-D-erythritol 2,4-cyclodiphosphate synthase